MRVFIITIDEPIYMNNYIKKIIEMYREDVVGVAVLNSVTKNKSGGFKRSIENILLGCLLFSKNDFAKIAYYKIIDFFACHFKIETHHRIADICRNRNIPIYHIDDPNNSGFIRILKSLGIDIILHQTPRILRGDLISVPSKCVISRHMSCLPAYRGAFPVFWQFYNKEKCYGLTIHKIDEGIDTGSIVFQRKLPREKGDSISSAYKKLFSMSATCTKEAFRAIEGGNALLEISNEKQSYYGVPKLNNIIKYVMGLN